MQEISENIRLMRKRKRRRNLLKSKITRILTLSIVLVVGMKFGDIWNKNQNKELSKTNTQVNTQLKYTGYKNPNSELLEKLKEMAKTNTKVLEILNQSEQYPEEILELLAGNEETVDFVFNYPAKQGTGTDESLGEISNNDIPELIQWDERWGYKNYGESILAISGCGPTALSMVAAGLTGDNSITPYVVAKYAEDNGYYVEGIGTGWSLMTEGSLNFGVKGTELSLSRDSVFSELANGNPIICSMRPGDFTTTGHFIVLEGIENGMIRVNDPNSKERSSKFWDYNTLERQIRNLWVFSNN